MKIKVWDITGYKGRNNHDGPSDDNMNITVAMDARFKKNDVEEIFIAHFSKKNETVKLSAKEITEYEVPVKTEESSIYPFHVMCVKDCVSFGSVFHRKGQVREVRGFNNFRKAYRISEDNGEGLISAAYFDEYFEKIVLEQETNNSKQ
jgi:hypothetical protein